MMTKPVTWLLLVSFFFQSCSTIGLDSGHSTDRQLAASETTKEKGSAGYSAQSTPPPPAANPVPYGGRAKVKTDGTPGKPFRETKKQRARRITKENRERLLAKKARNSAELTQMMLQRIQQRYLYGQTPILLEDAAVQELETKIKTRPSLQFNLASEFGLDPVKHRVVLVPGGKPGEKMIMVFNAAQSMPGLAGGKLAHHVVEMSASMASFYTGLAILNYYECAVSGDEGPCREFERSLLTPEGWIGFYLFSVNSKITGAVYGRLTNKAPKSVKGLGSSFAMVAGMFAQSLFNQLVPGIQAYKKALYVSNPKEREKAITEAKNALFEDAVANPEWWVGQVPGIVGLIGGVALAKATMRIGKTAVAGAKKGINAIGKIVWKGSTPILETAGKKAVNGMAVLPLFRFGFKGGKMVPYIGVFLSVAEHIVEVPIMMAWTHKIEHHVTPWFNAVMHREKIRAKKLEFFLALENYLAFYGKKLNPDTQKYLDAARAPKASMVVSTSVGIATQGSTAYFTPPKEILDAKFSEDLDGEERATRLARAHRYMESTASKLHEEWIKHREIYMSEAEKIVSARAMEAASIDQQLEQIKSAYYWANYSLSTENLFWKDNRGGWKDWFQSISPSEKRWGIVTKIGYGAGTAVSWFAPEVGIPIFLLTAGAHAVRTFTPIEEATLYGRLKFMVTRDMFCGPTADKSIDEAYGISKHRLPLIPDIDAAYDLNEDHLPLFRGQEIQPFGVIDYAELQSRGLNVKRGDYCPDYMQYTEEAKSGKFLFNLEEGVSRPFSGKDRKESKNDFWLKTDEIATRLYEAGIGSYLDKLCTEEVKRQGGTDQYENHSRELSKRLFCTNHEIAAEYPLFGKNITYEAVAEHRRVSLLAGPPRLAETIAQADKGTANKPKPAAYAMDFSAEIETAMNRAEEEVTPIKNFLLRKGLEANQEYLMEGILGEKAERTLLAPEKGEEGHLIRRYRWNYDPSKFITSDGWPKGYLSGLHYERDFWIEMHRQYGKYTERFSKLIGAIEQSQLAMEQYIDYIKDPFHSGAEVDRILDKSLSEIFRSTITNLKDPNAIAGQLGGNEARSDEQRQAMEMLQQMVVSANAEDPNSDLNELASDDSDENGEGSLISIQSGESSYFLRGVSDGETMSKELENSPEYKNFVENLKAQNSADQVLIEKLKKAE